MNFAPPSPELFPRLGSVGPHRPQSTPPRPRSHAPRGRPLNSREAARPPRFRLRVPADPRHCLVPSRPPPRCGPGPAPCPLRTAAGPRGGPLTGSPSPTPRGPCPTPRSPCPLPTCSVDPGVDGPTLPSSTGRRVAAISLGFRSSSRLAGSSDTLDPTPLLVPDVLEPSHAAGGWGEGVIRTSATGNYTQYICRISPNVPRLDPPARPPPLHPFPPQILVLPLDLMHFPPLPQRRGLASRRYGASPAPPCDPGRG